MSLLYDEYLSQERSDDLPPDFLMASYRDQYAVALGDLRFEFISRFCEFEFLESLLTSSSQSPLDAIVLNLQGDLIDLRESYIRLLVVYKLLCEKTGVEPDAFLLNVSFLDKEF